MLAAEQSTVTPLDQPRRTLARCPQPGREQACWPSAIKPRSAGRHIWWSAAAGPEFGA